MAIRRGSTPTITLTISGVDLTDATTYFTIRQGTETLTKTTGEDPSIWIEVYEDGSDVCVVLSQEDTLKFAEGVSEVQIRWIDADGTAHVSGVTRMTFDKVLLEGVIEHEDGQ